MKKESTVSVRVVWPFWRLLPDLEAELRVLRCAGFSEHELASPELRLPHTLAVQLLQRSLHVAGDPLLGIRAGLALESGDYGSLEYAARTAPDLRSAIELNIRYMHVLDDAMDAQLLEQGDQACWRLSSPIMRAHDAAADFALAASLVAARRYTGRVDTLQAVHVSRADVPDPHRYRELLQAEVVLGADMDALIFRREGLSQPLPHANPHLHKAHLRETELMFRQLVSQDHLATRVRKEVSARLHTGQFGMVVVARALHSTPATLRRRLAEEGTSHSQIVDEVRNELALKALSQGAMTVDAITQRLGYRSAQGFARAFRRWTGQSPRDYRASHGHRES